MKNHKLQADDDIGVVGGVDVPDALFMRFDSDDRIPIDDLGQQLYWLQKLNPGVIKFRQADISQMDDATKTAMISSIQYALGNAPLKDVVL